MSQTQTRQPSHSQSPVSPLAYNIPSFCKAVGIGRSKAYELIRNGQIKPIKIAGRTLVPASEAERLIAEAMA